MKRTAGTVISVITVLALTAASLIFGRFELAPSQTQALKTLLTVCACSIAYCFTVGEISGNNSQMDKLWSLLPIAYTWIIAVKGGLKTRLVVYALIVTAWGIRLTVNFARKGAYRLKFWSGEEDYRWAIVRQSPLLKNRFSWALFDLFFISGYQNLLVLAICLPALACMTSETPFGVYDFLSALFALAFFALETAADEYQWKFHQTKKKLLEKEGSLEKLPAHYNLGFNTTGPWSRMRHPNYLGEQGMWMSLYFFTVGAGVTQYGVFHPTFAGPLLLVLLFVGSSALSEKISKAKYPEYARYVQTVFKYLPVRKLESGRVKIKFIL